MVNSELTETGQQYMIKLFEQTRGDSGVQVSMYDIGGLLDLERSDSARVAEELIGLQLVDIKTLSGGIGISAAGLEMVQALTGAKVSEADAAVKLNDGRLLNSAGRQLVEQIVAEIKDQAGTLGLDFDTLSELMADLKSIDAQLGSSRPKTAIVKACLGSIAEVFEHCSGSAMHGRITVLLDG